MPERWIPRMNELRPRDDGSPFQTKNKASFLPLDARQFLHINVADRFTIQRGLTLCF